MKSVCVYCGSSAGTDPAFTAAATQVGQTLAQQGIVLVYGGGRAGLMGSVADAALAAGGKVVGVIPQRLVEKEAAHQGLTQLHVVPDMHTRKAMMAKLAEGFLALPGGVGTFEELFETFTWLQLGYHKLPVAVLDVAGYYAPLAALMRKSVESGFVGASNASQLLMDTNIEVLLDRMRAFEPMDSDAWLKSKFQQEAAQQL
ncbi:MAG: TIGR00730 family Rossman fold protein [Burkholderiaceae bacterium]